MDIESRSLADIKAMNGRNLDASVDENTLVSGEKADGTFGVFNFFQGIKNFFKGISALGTLASGSRIVTTDASGNVKYTTMNDINNYVVNNALTNYRKRYGSIADLQRAKGVTITLVNGEDNTQKILDNLSEGEIFSDYFSNSTANSRFGIDSSLGNYFIITFEKMVGIMQRLKLRVQYLAQY